MELWGDIKSLSFCKIKDAQNEKIEGYNRRHLTEKCTLPTTQFNLVKSLGSQRSSNLLSAAVRANKVARLVTREGCFPKESAARVGLSLPRSPYRIIWSRHR
jgi:hypothetical protein